MNNKYIVTFGSGQVHEGLYLEIKAFSVSDIQTYMSENYNNKYCMIYSKCSWDKWVKEAKENGFTVEKKLYEIDLTKEVVKNEQ